MAAWLYPLFTLSNFMLLIMGGWLYLEAPSAGLGLFLIVLSAIAYDNTVVSIGRWVSSQRLLLWLSQPRFLLHIVLTPLSIVMAYDLGVEGHGWRAIPSVSLLIWGIALALIAYELCTYYQTFEPVLVIHQGIHRYTNSSACTPPIPAILTVVIIGLIGGILWWNLAWPWLCISALIMLVGSAIPPKVVGPALCSGAEALLMLFFWITALCIR